jgi:hypothetical protein
MPQITALFSRELPGPFLRCRRGAPLAAAGAALGWFIIGALAGCSGEPIAEPDRPIAASEDEPKKSAKSRTPSSEDGTAPKPASRGTRKTARTPADPQDPPAVVEGSPAGERPTKAAPPPRPVRKDYKGQPSKVIDALLQDLQDSDKRRVEAAFWRLAEIPKEFIPALIAEVEGKEMTKLDRIQILILDKDLIVPGEPFLVTRVHGLGRMETVRIETGEKKTVAKEYTKVAYGLTKSKKNYRLAVDRKDGFPLGVVIRAGLINRFRSTDYPSLDDDDPTPGRLIAWWRAFYARVKDDL